MKGTFVKENPDRPMGLTDLLLQGRCSDLRLPISEKYPQCSFRMTFRYQIVSGLKGTRT
jgi:hypothetical protein